MLRNKNNLRKKFTPIITLVFVLCLFFSYPQKTQAALWPAIDPMISRMLDTVYATVQGMILGALKQAAVKMLNGQVDSLVSGQGTGDAAFITDWKDYLVTQPKSDTKVYMNSYLSEMTAGRGTSLTGYASEGFSGSGNYASTLTQVAKNMLAKKDAAPALTLEGDPSKMFAGKDFKMLAQYVSGVNNPWAFDMAAESAYQKKLAEEERIKQARAIAYQGFKGTTSGQGESQTITYPGILTKEIVANVENLPNNVIASANSIPEVITSVVSQMITKAIQQGFSSVQKSAQKQTGSQNKLDAGTNSAMDASGPAARFNVIGR